MNKQIEALKMARQTLYKWGTANDELACEFVQAVRMIDKALAEAEKQEPVAVIETYSDTPTATTKSFTIRKRIRLLDHIENLPLGNLYTHPDTWQSLSNDEIEKVFDDIVAGCYGEDDFWIRFASAIEQALKEKNHD